MRFINIVHKDWLLLAQVFFDAWLPLWRMLPKSVRAGKTTNAFLVLAMVAVTLWLGTLSPYPDGGFVLKESAEYTGPTLTVSVLIWQVIAGMWVCLLTMLAFGVDLFDALREGDLSRFVFADEQTGANQRNLATGVLFLFCGYAMRIWMFGVGTLLCLQAVNTLSVLHRGRELIVEGLVSAPGIGSLILQSMQSPLGEWRTRGSEGFLPWIVGTLSLIRWLVITLGLGTFYSLIPKLTTKAGPTPGKGS